MHVTIRPPDRPRHCPNRRRDLNRPGPCRATFAGVVTPTTPSGPRLSTCPSIFFVHS